MKPTTPSRRALWLALLASLGLGMALFAACNSGAVPNVTPTLTPAPTPTPAWPVTVFIPAGQLPVPVADALNPALAAHPDLFAPAPS
ncbi:MAG: hypothetical protein V3T90_00620, partial [Anaerolineae bacterium]